MDSQVVWDKFVFEDEEQTMLQVTARTLDYLPKNEGLLNRVGNAYQWGLVLVGTAAALISDSGGFLMGAGPRDKEEPKQPQPQKPADPQPVEPPPEPTLPPFPR
jgi:hypothetical protein